MGKIGTRKNWKRSLILTFAAVMVFGATVFAAEKYIGISSFFQEVGNKMPEEAKELIEKDPVQQEDGDSIVIKTVSRWWWKLQRKKEASIFWQDKMP